MCSQGLIFKFQLLYRPRPGRYVGRHVTVGMLTDARSTYRSTFDRYSTDTRPILYRYLVDSCYLVLFSLSTQMPFIRAGSWTKWVGGSVELNAQERGGSIGVNKKQRTANENAAVVRRIEKKNLLVSYSFFVYFIGKTNGIRLCYSYFESYKGRTIKK